jgi:hypothetical protein
LQELNGFPQEAREKLRAKAAESPEEAEKVGNTLLLVIERVSDLDKPRLLGQLFIAYLDSVISADDLRRLVHAVDVAFVDDLQKLLRSGAPSSSGAHLEFLVSSGLSRVVTGSTWDEVGKISYETTMLAYEMLKAYYHVNGIPESPLNQFIGGIGGVQEV